MNDQEGKALEQMAASMAEAMHLAARTYQQMGRAFEQMAATMEAWRGHMAANREALGDFHREQASQELRDTVYPEGARARTRSAAAPPRARVPLPEASAGASGDLDKPIPWATFYEERGILGPQAVSIIRSRFPSALKPAEDEPEEERSAWPEDGTPEEVQAAVTRLEGLDDQRAIAAQTMIVEVMAGEEGGQG